MPKLFLISGLGADERLFKKLDLSGYDVINVNYILPERQDSLKSYAGKLIEEYKITDQSNVIGVSLGGILSVEIAKQVQLKKAIIISSIKSGAEFPWFFKFFRALPFHLVISGKFVQLIGPLITPVFTRFGKSGEAPLFVRMLRESDPRFLTWAIRAILKWDGKPASYPIHHLIGNADLVFHYSRIKDAIVIPRGDHLMVYTRAAEISLLIKNILNA